MGKEIILLVFVLLFASFTAGAYTQYDEFSGTVQHVSLAVNVTCETMGGWIECTACKEGHLDDYKWEIQDQDGVLVGSTDWIDWDGISTISVSNAFHEAEWYAISIYVRNDWNETAQSSTSKASGYTIPDLPFEIPDPGVIPDEPLDIDELPDAGEYNDDRVEVPVFGWLVNKGFIVLMVFIVSVFLLRFYLRWNKEFGKRK